LQLVVGIFFVQFKSHFVQDFHSFCTL